MLRAIFNLFNNVLSRRADYIEANKNVRDIVFPKQFCSLRWIENGSVSSTAIQIREIYKLFCLKLINKSPLKYSLTKAISCFDPRVAIDKKIIASRFIDLISILADNSQHCNVIKHKKNLKI